MDVTDTPLAELEQLIASLQELDPAEAVEPAEKIAEILGRMLEAEEER